MPTQHQNCMSSYIVTSLKSTFCIQIVKTNTIHSIYLLTTVDRWKLHGKYSCMGPMVEWEEMFMVTVQI